MKVMLEGGQEFQVGGQPIHVVFYYNPPLSKRELKKGRRGVACRIRRAAPAPGQPPEILAEGLAVCSEEDQFRKEVGRKYAFERALHALADLAGEDHKEERKQLHHWFHQTHRQPVAVPADS